MLGLLLSLGLLIVADRVGAHRGQVLGHVPPAGRVPASALTVVFCGSSPRARRWDLLGLMDPVGKGFGLAHWLGFFLGAAAVAFGFSFPIGFSAIRM